MNLLRSAFFRRLSCSLASIVLAMHWLAPLAGMTGFSGAHPLVVVASDGQNNDGQYENGQHEDGEHEDGEHEDGQHGDGQHGDGQNNDGQHDNGQH